MFDILTHLQMLVGSVNGWITQTLHGNTIVAGAVTASIAGSLFYVLRKLPLQLWGRIRRYIFFTYDIEYGSRDSNAMINIIAAKLEYMLQRRVSEKRASARLIARKKRLTESLSNGSFFFWHKRALILVSRHQEKQINTGGKSSGGPDTTVTLSLTSLRIHRKTILQILNENTKEYMVPGIYQLLSNSWNAELPYVRRVRNFTSLPPLTIDWEIKKKIDDALDNFLKYREQNNESDLPHKLTIMLYGEPGTGKSALAEYIAYRLKTSLFCTNAISLGGYGSIGIADSIEAARDNIADGDVPVVLFDDIDTIWSGIQKRSSKPKEDPATNPYDKKNEEQSIDENKPSFQDRVALGKLLAPLQSPVEINDCVAIFNTNHLETIDPAMYRPGRMTLLIEVGRLKPKSIMEYFQQRYNQAWPEHTPIERALRACDIAAFYEANRENPQGFIDAVTSMELAADEKFREKESKVTI